MKRLVSFVDRGLGSIEFAVIATFSLAALAIGTAQVVMRYLFNTGFHWTEAVFVLLTVSAMLFGGSRAVRDDAHVRVDLIPQLLPRRTRKPLRILRYIVSLALVAVYFRAGLGYMGFTWGMGIADPSSGLPIWFIYLIVPVTMGAFAIRYVILLLREAWGEETGRSESDEAAEAARHGGSGT